MYQNSELKSINNFCFKLHLQFISESYSFFSTLQLVEITQALGCDKPTSGNRACLDEKHNIHTKKKKQPTDSCIMAGMLR